MVTSPTDLIQVTETDDLVTVTFDRPEKRNAVNFEVIEGLLDIVEELDADGEKGILFTGNGPVTCAGADLEILTGDDEEASYRLRRRFSDVFDVLQSYRRPTVIGAKGGVIGGGCQLAVTCDFCVIGEETAFYKPEIQYDIMSGYTTSLLKHAVGTQAAREIALTGTAIPPERVAALGIAIDVVPEDEVDARARELAEDLCAYDPEAYARGKSIFAFEKTPDDFRRAGE